MKRLESIETDKYALEIIECDCGYHMGVDATFIKQVNDFVTICPSCSAIIDTEEILIENPYFCNKCGQHFKIHNDDGSCVEDDKL